MSEPCPPVAGDPPCPLCGAAGPRRTETLAAADLAELYRRSLGVDAAPEFAGIESLGFHHCSGCDLRFFHPPAAGSAALYAQLRRFDWYYLGDKSEYALAARRIPPGESVLDVGCGRGAFAAHLPGRAFTGLELTPESAADARRAGLDVREETLEAHAAAHPGAHGAVTAFQVLEHVPDPAAFLRAMLACLRPGGLLIVSVPAADSFCGTIRNNALNLPPHHLSWWSDRCLEGLGRVIPAAQFVALEKETLGPEHYAYYARNAIANALAGSMGLRFRALDRRAGYRAASAVAARFAGAGAKLAAKFAGRIRGQSVTAVYRRSDVS